MHLHHRISFTFLFLALALYAGAGESGTSSESSDDSWAALLNEVNEGMDEFSGEDPEPVDESWSPTFQWSASLGAGYGYTDNALKGESRVSTAIQHLSAEGYFNWTPRESRSLTGILFAEADQFQRSLPVDGERIVFARLQYEMHEPAATNHIALEYFYGDQIFDTSSDLVDTITAGRVILNQMESNLGREFYLTARDALKFSLAGGRTEYDDPLYDQFFGGPGIQYTRIWNKRLETVATASYRYEAYDNNQTRSPVGLPSGDRALRIHVWNTSLETTYHPFASWPVELNAFAGLRRENDNGEGYEDVITTRAGLGVTWESSKWRVRTAFDTRMSDYDERVVGFTDDRLLWRQKDTASLSLSRQLFRHWEISSEFEWARLRSRDSSNEYEAREAFLKIHYRL